MIPSFVRCSIPNTQDINSDGNLLQKCVKNKVKGNMLSLKNKADPLMSQSGKNMSFVLSANYSAPSGHSLNIWQRCGKLHKVPTVCYVKLTELMVRDQSIVLLLWGHNWCGHDFSLQTIASLISLFSQTHYCQIDWTDTTSVEMPLYLLWVWQRIN